jgi:hypothetical protein
LGNIKGNKSIRFVKEDMKAASSDEKRQMIVDLNIDVKGNSDAANVFVYAVAKDLKTPKINTEDVKPDEYIDINKHIKFIINSVVNEYDSITPNKTYNPSIKAICPPAESDAP